ncbi:MAG: sterol desaturase family protein [Thauera sp.]|nr:sterol desaturase family protein [Thauera sp.]
MKLLDLVHARTTVFPQALPLAAAVAAGMTLLAATRPHGTWLLLLPCGLGGLALWTLLEYLLHRFVLHRVEPFRRWHLEHHRTPDQPMRTPILFSMMLLAGLAAVPLLVIGDQWLATGITLGLIAGHMAQEVTHHTLHRPGTRGGWIEARFRQHDRHHHQRPDRAYGTLTAIWDRLLGTL